MIMFEWVCEGVDYLEGVGEEEGMHGWMRLIRHLDHEGGVRKGICEAWLKDLVSDKRGVLERRFFFGGGGRGRELRRRKGGSLLALFLICLMHNNHSGRGR